MKGIHFFKSFSAAAAAMVFTLSIFCDVYHICGIQPLTADSASAPVLKIEQVQVSESSLESDRTVQVEVSISDNPEGLLATSFGIRYDSDLTFEGLRCDSTIGLAHSYAHNPDTGLLWFCGADASGQTTANAEPEEVIMTLTFTAPLVTAVGTSYPITFCWEKANGKDGYWYLPDRTNVLDTVRANALDGGISIPDPDAPQLEQTLLTVSTGCTKELSVLNYSGDVVWISDNTEVASVTDGIVTGIAEGTCTIYAMLGTTALTCTVQVTEDAYYNITETDIIYLTDPDKTVIVEYPAAEGTTVNWLSEKENIVTVSNGVLTGIQNGSASVYAIGSAGVQQVKVVVAFSEEERENAGTGDVTEDGKVNILDVIILNRSILAGDKLTDSQQAAGDVDMSSSLDAADALNILKYSIGLLDTLPLALAE